MQRAFCAVGRHWEKWHNCLDSKAISTIFTKTDTGNSGYCFFTGLFLFEWKVGKLIASDTSGSWTMLNWSLSVPIGYLSNNDQVRLCIHIHLHYNSRVVTPVVLFRSWLADFLLPLWLDFWQTCQEKCGPTASSVLLKKKKKKVYQ